MTGEDRGRPIFLDRRLDLVFEKRVVVFAPGGSRTCGEAEWRGALVVVERGEIELETTAGARRCFGRGDILCLAGLSLRALRNRGEKSAILVAVSRRHPQTD